jgi:hypothetical protein
LMAAGSHMEALSRPGPTEGVVRCYVRWVMSCQHMSGKN